MKEGVIGENEHMDINKGRAQNSTERMVTKTYFMETSGGGKTEVRVNFTIAVG